MVKAVMGKRGRKGRDWTIASGGAEVTEERGTRKGRKRTEERKMRGEIEVG